MSKIKKGIVLVFIFSIAFSPAICLASNLRVPMTDEAKSRMNSLYISSEQNELFENVLAELKSNDILRISDAFLTLENNNSHIKNLTPDIESELLRIVTTPDASLRGQMGETGYSDILHRGATLLRKYTHFLEDNDTKLGLYVNLYDITADTVSKKYIAILIGSLDKTPRVKAFLKQLDDNTPSRGAADGYIDADTHKRVNAWLKKNIKITRRREDLENKLGVYRTMSIYIIPGMLKNTGVIGHYGIRSQSIYIDATAYKRLKDTLVRHEIDELINLMNFGVAKFAKKDYAQTMSDIWENRVETSHATPVSWLTTLNRSLPKEEIASVLEKLVNWLNKEGDPDKVTEALIAAHNASTKIKDEGFIRYVKYLNEKSLPSWWYEDDIRSFITSPLASLSNREDIEGPLEVTIERVAIMDSDLDYIVDRVEYRMKATYKLYNGEKETSYITEKSLLVEDLIDEITKARVLKEVPNVDKHLTRYKITIPRKSSLKQVEDIILNVAGLSVKPKILAAAPRPVRGAAGNMNEEKAREVLARSALDTLLSKLPREGGEETVAKKVKAAKDLAAIGTIPAVLHPLLAEYIAARHYEYENKKVMPILLNAIVEIGKKDPKAKKEIVDSFGGFLEKYIDSESLDDYIDISDGGKQRLIEVIAKLDPGRAESIVSYIILSPKSRGVGLQRYAFKKADDLGIGYELDIEHKKLIEKYKKVTNASSKINLIGQIASLGQPQNDTLEFLMDDLIIYHPEWHDKVTSAIKNAFLKMAKKDQRVKTAILKLFTDTVEDQNYYSKGTRGGRERLIDIIAELDPEQAKIVVQNIIFHTGLTINKGEYMQAYARKKAEELGMSDDYLKSLKLIKDYKALDTPDFKIYTMREMALLENPDNDLLVLLKDEIEENSLKAPEVSIEAFNTLSTIAGYTVMASAFKDIAKIARYLNTGEDELGAKGAFLKIKPMISSESQLKNITKLEKYLSTNKNKKEADRALEEIYAAIKEASLEPDSIWSSVLKKTKKLFTLL